MVNTSQDWVHWSPNGQNYLSACGARGVGVKKVIAPQEATCPSCLAIAREGEAVSEKEQVDHPSHYGGDTVYETIKVLAAWMSPEQLFGFCVANAIKYLSRAGKKSSESMVKDLSKARWYIDYMIKRLEGKE